MLAEIYRAAHSVDDDATKIVGQMVASPAAGYVYDAARDAIEIVLQARARSGVSAASNSVSQPASSILSIQSPSLLATAPNTTEGWRAEWAASAELQAEFPDAECYAGFRRGEASGRTALISSVGRPTNATSPEGWRAEWAASAELQSEFPVIGDYLALRKGEAAGRVKVIRR